MGIIRPATPGFLVCLTATALFAVVTFNVPYIKSIYFLKATLTQQGITGSVVFGTLGYCLTLPNGTTCSKPSVGYELNVNALLGDDTFIQIPNVLVKWITYALVLHIVALILSGIAAFMGLLAHVREMSMAYCSSFVAGFGASVGITAFIFDLVLFFVTKSRVNDVSGASASFGTAIWLTLAGWLLLFFAGCFYSVGRCCVRRRSRDWNNKAVPGGDGRYAEQMRLDAVKAEADRKARQKQGEGGLPAFNEYEQMQPLTRKLSDEQFVEDGDAIVPLAGVGAYGHGGTTRPFPGAQRQGSGHTQTTSGYAPSTQSYNALAAAAGVTAAGAASGYSHGRQPTAASEYGHGAQNTSYYSTGTAHQQMPLARAIRRHPILTLHMRNSRQRSNAYYGRAQTQDRSYTLGGGGYGASTVPQFDAAADAAYGETAYNPYGGPSRTPVQMPMAPSPIDTRLSPSPGPTARMTSTSPRGPRPSSALVQSPVQDMPEPGHQHQPQYADSMWATKN
ncbi:SUR7/PalI family-domain-containing protein [Amylocystis lapponica]|nr:SUR7/PalI family-domain-containing protein [Amylocystis lapponica]